MKYPAFVISGVWKDTVERITHVYLHPVGADGTIGKGEREAVVAVIGRISDGKRVQTLVWNYYAACWNFGALVTVGGYGLGRYLRTRQDEMVKDDLSNLITMSEFL